MVIHIHILSWKLNCLYYLIGVCFYNYILHSKNIFFTPWILMNTLNWSTLWNCVWVWRATGQDPRRDHRRIGSYSSMRNYCHRAVSMKYNTAPPYAGLGANGYPGEHNVVEAACCPTFRTAFGGDEPFTTIFNFHCICTCWHLYWCVLMRARPMVECK